MKMCSTCRERKPLSEFGKNKRRKDGLHYSCRSCVKVSDAATFQRHKAKRMAESAEWARNNPEARRAIVRRYMSRTEVRERENARMRNYRATVPGMKERGALSSRRWRGSNPDRLAYQRVKITIAHQAGLKYRDIPDTLAEAKIAQLQIIRELRNR